MTELTAPTLLDGMQDLLRSGRKAATLVVAPDLEARANELLTTEISLGGTPPPTGWEEKHYRVDPNMIEGTWRLESTEWEHAKP